ncbi:MAG: hypothetical protein ACN4EU_04745, partial [Brevundimonas mediterranea]
MISSSPVSIADHDLAFRGWLLSGRDGQTEQMREAMTACGYQQNSASFDMRMPRLPFSGMQMP